jgi:hypothetical protein
MEKLVDYRGVLREIVECEACHQPANGEIEALAICDDQHEQYQLLHVGWNRLGRVFGVIIHARLHQGKIWIEHDGTETSVAASLVAAGVPAEDIVLAFQPPRKRPYTAFAVA